MAVGRVCTRCGEAAESARSRFCGACGHPFVPGDRGASGDAPDPVRLPTRWWSRALPLAGSLLVLAAGIVAVLYVLRPAALGPVARWLDGQEWLGERPRDEPADFAPPEARHPGLGWHGIDGGERDLTASAPVADADGTFALRYRSVDRAGVEVTGTLRVRTMGPRVSALLELPDGAQARAFDGIFSPDGTFVSGASWALPGSPTGPQRELWWATVEREAAPEGAAPLDVNRLSVAGLERAGLSPRVARLVVEGRLIRGPYLSLDPLLVHAHVPAPERRLLRERAVVR